MGITIPAVQKLGRQITPTVAQAALLVTLLESHTNTLDPKWVGYADRQALDLAVADLYGQLGLTEKAQRIVEHYFQPDPPEPEPEAK